MLLRLAAFAALTAVLCIPAHARSPAVVQHAVLTLDDAFARVDRSHPDLRLLQGPCAVLGADLERAALRLPLVAGVDVENAGGVVARVFPHTGITLRLASVLQRVGNQGPGQPHHL